MAKEINLSNFLSHVKEYENMHDLWCAKLVANGLQSIQSVCNNINNEELTNLMDSFMKFVSLLAQCKPNYNKSTLKQSEQSLKQNESLDLLSKNDIIKMVNNDLQCPICSEWLLKATSANCNHTFCEKCIQKWLKINKTCPVCRSTIQYTSTSLAIDNFISNLCQLIGGFIKERRESIQNVQIDCNDNQTNLNNSVDGQIYDLNTSNDSVVEDTYYISLLENTTPMQHPNMARLIPLQSNTPETRTNIRQAAVFPSSAHHNVAELSPFPRSSAISSRPNQIQSTFTSVGSPQLNSVQSTSTSSLNHRDNCLQPKPLASVKSHCSSRTKHVSSMSTASPRINISQPSSSMPTVSSRVNCIQPTSSTSIINRHGNRFQHCPASLFDNKNNRIRTNTNSKSPTT